MDLLKVLVILVVSFQYRSTEGAAAVNQNTEKECTLDLIFVLDGSGSVGKQNFELVKTYVKNVAMGIVNSASHDTQLGVVQYSHYFSVVDAQPYLTTEVMLGHHSYKNFSMAVDAIVYQGYTTYTAAALRFVKKDFVGSARYNVTGNSQVMILITDGRSNDRMELPKSAEELRAIGVVPYAIGIGDAVQSELREIATGKQDSGERVFQLNNFPELQSINVDLKKYIENC